MAVCKLKCWGAHKCMYFADLPSEPTSFQQYGCSINQYPELPSGPSSIMSILDRRVQIVSSSNRTSSCVLNIYSTNPATECSIQHLHWSATSHIRMFAHQLCCRWTLHVIFHSQLPIHLFFLFRLRDTIFYLKDNIKQLWAAFYHKGGGEEYCRRFVSQYLEMSVNIQKW